MTKDEAQAKLTEQVKLLRIANEHGNLEEAVYICNYMSELRKERNSHD